MPRIEFERVYELHTGCIYCPEQKSIKQYFQELGPSKHRVRWNMMQRFGKLIASVLRTAADLQKINALGSEYVTNCGSLPAVRNSIHKFWQHDSQPSVLGVLISTSRKTGRCQIRRNCRLVRHSAIPCRPQSLVLPMFRYIAYMVQLIASTLLILQKLKLAYESFQIRPLLTSESQNQSSWSMAHTSAHLSPTSQSQSHITTDNQSASPSWCQGPIWDPQQIFLSPRDFLLGSYCLVFYSALSDERTGL
jgi:hypothetical protein